MENLLKRAMEDRAEDESKAKRARDAEASAKRSADVAREEAKKSAEEAKKSTEKAKESAEKARDAFIMYAKIANKAHRYDKAAGKMKYVAELDTELSNEEWNLLVFAYKEVAKPHRSSWTALSIEKEATSENEKSVAKLQRQEVEVELARVYHEMLELLERLILKASTSESKVRYLKTKADHFRYLGEVTADQESRSDLRDKAKGAYQEALDIAQNNLRANDKVRLRLVQNYSFFYFKTLDNSFEAIELAQKAVEMARKATDPISEDAKAILDKLETSLDIYSKGFNQSAYLRPSSFGWKS